jgi:hypothetical protein
MHWKERMTLKREEKKHITSAPAGVYIIRKE